LTEQKPESGDEPGGAEAPKNVTIEDVKALLKRRDEALVTKFDTRIGELKTLLAQNSAEAETGASGDDTPAIRALKRKLEETNARVKAAEDARAAEAAKTADIRLRKELAEALIANDVDPKIATHVGMLLIDGEKRVHFDGDEIVFRDDNRGEVTLATGLKSWLKGEDAQRFLVPLGTAGSGDTRSGKSASAPKAGKGPYNGMTYEELAVKFRDALSGQGSMTIG
jgi:hypothetical protein